jgi:hypothetical protein
MPVETYIGCLVCLQHSDYDCQRWHAYNTNDTRTEGVIQMERLKGGIVRVYSARIKGWVIGKLDSDCWINWNLKKDDSDSE